jgi:polyisoprenoid-binding protein YceI
MEIDGCLSNAVPGDLFSPRRLQIDRKEVAMSVVVSPQDRLAGSWIFDADNHPEITFTSDELKIDGNKVEFDGELTIKGTTQALHATGTVEGPTEDFMGKTRLGLTVKAVIDRTAYGVSWNADLPRGGRALSDDVELTVELEFVRAA